MLVSWNRIGTFSLTSMFISLAVIPLITGLSITRVEAKIIGSSEGAESSKMNQVSHATTQFAFNYMKTVPSGTNSNLIFSPLSMQTLMNLILLGTTEKSASQTELFQALSYNGTGLTSDRLHPHQALSQVLSSLKTTKREEKSPNDESGVGEITYRSQQQSDPVNMSLANLVLYNGDKIELKENYANELETYYQAQTEKFYKSSLKGLSERVNKWVDEKTNQKIHKIVGDSDLDDEDLIMVLLNAAHFKGAWKDKFEKVATNYRQFFNLGLENNIKHVKFMHHIGHYGYADLTQRNDSETANKSLAHQLDCQVLSMPFANPHGDNQFSMVLLLPRELDGLAKLEASISSKSLMEVYELLKMGDVDVRMPKFGLESSLDVKASLSEMGVKWIFEDAHLDQMYKILPNTTGNVAKVDKIIHKAMIKVDEDGAEAAAATVATIVLKSSFLPRPMAPKFEANHPFMFIIRHDESNLPIFMGRVSDLAKKE